MPRKPGNHGIVIPRDRELLHRLYWIENRTLPEIGAMFDVTHKSVERVFRDLGIPRRKVGVSRHRGCKKCGTPIHKIKHAGNGSLYGTLCKQHWDQHRAMLAKQEAATPKGAERRKRLLRRWYYHGPLNPTGESEWLSRGRAILRSAKRLLANPATREAFRSQSVASEQAPTLLT